MYLAAALCLLLCGCGKKNAAEAQAVQQRYAALTGAVAEEEPVYAELSREGKLLLSVRFTAFQQTKSDGGE